MISPFLGKSFNLDTIDDLIFNYIELKRIKFVFQPDKLDIYKVNLEYSFDNWKSNDLIEMSFSNKDFEFFTFLEFNNFESVSYRYLVYDTKNGKPRFFNKKNHNYFLNLPNICFENSDNFENEIGEMLANGKIISTSFSSSSITSWSLGHQSILSDIRNKRLDEFCKLHFGKKFPFQIAIIFKDRLSEYFTPNTDSDYGEKISYIDRRLHPYILPFKRKKLLEYRYFTLSRNNIDSPLVNILKKFEKITKHPIIWSSNSGTQFSNFNKPENEVESFYNFLNSYTDCIFFNSLKVYKRIIDK